MPSSLLVRGTAFNRTEKRPAVGDEVVLVRLDHGMQEEARTVTDARGAFTLSLRSPDRSYLVRVAHQSVAYFQRVTPGEPLAIDVFDSAIKVRGISGKSAIVRISMNGSLLHVSEMLEIANASLPPRTQAGPRSFEVFLPAKAQLDTVLAASPGGLAVLASAKPIASEPGRYAIDFPLHPGSTKFAVNYNLPYSGSAVFRPKMVYPVRQFAVMAQKGIIFASREVSFHRLVVNNPDFQVYALKNLPAGNSPEFSISGSPPGSLSAPSNAAPAQVSSSSTPLVASAVSFAIPQSRGLGSLSIVLWIVVSFLSIALLIWALRRSQARKIKPTTDANPPQPVAAEALKRELFQLEADRLQGEVSPEDYEKTKQALDRLLQRMLARPGA